jgi:hypothetical protein
MSKPKPEFVRMASDSWNGFLKLEQERIGRALSVDEMRTALRKWKTSMERTHEGTSVLDDPLKA